jgi:hypothetical protein
VDTAAVRNDSSSAATAEGLVTKAPNRDHGARTTSPITGNTINARAAKAGSHSTPGNADARPRERVFGPVRTVCGSLVWVTR